jgi:hypothetical protein
VGVIKIDYSTSSLLEAFRDQDAIVSAIATFPQVPIVDATVTAGVKRFIPS